MKAKFFALMAVVLAVVSCQKDVDSLDVNMGGNVATISVTLPENAITRAAADETNSAWSGLQNVKGETLRVIFQVYDENGVTNENLRQVKTLTEGETSANFDVRLVPDRQYTFVAWADQGEEYFDAANLKDVKILSWEAMDECRDAYTATHTEEKFNSASNITLELTRPFAKLRVITTDMEQLGHLNIAPAEAEVEYTVALPIAFNAFAGEAGTTTTNKTFANFDIAEYNQDAANTMTLFTDYILVPANNVVKFSLKTMQDGGREIKTNNFNTDIPVKRNNLTTIAGNILTDGNNINVEVKPEFDGETEWPNGELGKVAMFGGEITLTEDVTLTEPLLVKGNTTINLNGKTITGSHSKSVGAIIKNEGTLTIVGGTVSSTGANGGSAIQNNGQLIIDGTEIIGSSIRENEGWPSYPINNYGSSIIIKNAKITGYQGAIACNTAGTVTLEDCTINKEYLNTSSHVFYINHDEAKVIVNGGTYTHNGMDGSLAYVNKGIITINGGTFDASNGGYGIAALTNGNVVINGGTFNNALLNWGGSISIKGGTFKAKPDASYLAPGYYALQYETGKYTVQAFDAAARTLTINSKDEFLKLSTLDAKWNEFFSNGQGTEFENFMIENGGKGTDFYYKWEWTIKLNTDIDFENATLNAPISVTKFGYFDGQNHTIKNVKIQDGLFVASSTKLQNIKLDNIHVTAGYDGNSTAGILASDCNGGIDNITIANSSVVGGKYTGGVVGYGYTYVTNCTLTNCVVKGGYKCGGVIGYICASNADGHNVTGNTLTNCTVVAAPQHADGKSEFILGKVVGNYNCNGTCADNVINNMTTTATALIGKIEAGNVVNESNNYVSSNVDTSNEIKAAVTEENATVNVAAGEYTFPSSVAAGVTIQCEEGTVFTGTSGLNINGATVIGAEFKNEDGIAVSGTINGTFKNCTFNGEEALRWCYANAGDTITFEDCVIKTDFRGFHFDGMEGNVIFRNCEINGFNAYGGEGTATFEGCTIGCDQSSYAGLNIYSNTNLVNCTFNYVSGKTNFIDMEGTGKTLKITNCKVYLDGVEADIKVYVGGSKLAENTVIYE